MDKTYSAGTFSDFFQYEMCCCLTSFPGELIFAARSACDPACSMALSSAGADMVASLFSTDLPVVYNKQICQHNNKDFCNLILMETYAERLAWAMDRAAIGQNELARLVGIKQQSIQYLRNPKNAAGGSRYNAKIALALGVSPEWLEAGIGEPIADQARHKPGEACTSMPVNIEPAPGIRCLVPLISWVQAGNWSEVIDSLAPGDAEDWLPCMRHVGPHAFALRVRGVSMEPKYQDGDIIFVDPDAPAEHGRNVVVRLEDDNEATFKQLVVEGEHKFLKPLNPDWPGPKLLPINGNASLCGVVVGKWVSE
ncbi:LexA family protein [Laribacter hongkongensis]|uniref:LexA family protein n=1 Tax=Laribacter hongkongensis TaxID=168471 RepID=UPI001FD56A74|nr:LexA family transcriptional regulator [Laribacter hongkongensis]